MCACMYVFLSLQDGVCLEKRLAESERLRERYPDRRINVCSILFRVYQFVFMLYIYVFKYLSSVYSHESLMARGKIRSLACMLLTMRVYVSVLWHSCVWMLLITSFSTLISPRIVTEY